MIPDNLKKKHIIQAINEARNAGVPIGRGSKKYLLKHENDYFPTKYIISLANKYANGIILDRSLFSGGEESNNFLNNLGFKIIEVSSLTTISIKNLKKQNKISSTKIHTGENCSECKRVIKELLERIYGKIETNYRFSVGSKPEDFISNKYHEKLKEIFEFLQSFRGCKEFVKAKNLPHCDYYIPNQGIIIEFDESQHFTPLRALTLLNYPTDINLGFDKNKWIELCEKTKAKDNNPFYRDEQRAWYDTLRDFLPLLDIKDGKSVRTVIRLYAKDFEWCSLKPNNPSDIKEFRDILGKHVSRYKIEMREDPDPVLARLIMVGKWKGKFENSREVLEEIYKKWPKNKRVKFMITCGGFLELKSFQTIVKEDIGCVREPKTHVVQQLVEEAIEYVKLLIDNRIKNDFAKITDYLTIGIDLFQEDNTELREKHLHMELVLLIDLKKDELHWTGKSYPTQSQENKLVRISDLSTHFNNLDDVGEIAILGCHDLTVFNPRSKKAKRWRKKVNEEFVKLILEKKPVYILQHPHGTAKIRSWLNAWRKIEKEKNLSNVKYASSGRYYDSKREEKDYDSLEDVLLNTKNIDTIDIIVSEI